MVSPPGNQLWCKLSKLPYLSIIAFPLPASGVCRWQRPYLARRAADAWSDLPPRPTFLPHPARWQWCHRQGIKAKFGCLPLPATATCADGNGLISRDELLQTLSKQGVTVQGIDDIIAEVDKDGNGHIDYFEVRRRSAVQDFDVQGELGQRCQQAAFFSELLALCGLDRCPRDCSNCKCHWWPARRQADPHPAAPPGCARAVLRNAARALSQSTGTSELLSMR